MINSVKVLILLALVLFSNMVTADGNLISLKIDEDIVYFATNEAKAVTSPNCMSAEYSDQWTVSLNNTTGKAIYALLVAAIANNEKVTVESAGDCSNKEGYERALNVTIVEENNSYTGKKNIVTELTIAADTVYFSTNEAKELPLPSCVIADKNHQWSLSLNTISGKAAYGLLVAAVSADKRIKVEGANDCSVVAGIERVKSLAIVNNEAKSCDELYQKNTTLTSGRYEIYSTSRNGQASSVYCDMTSDGGWTLVMRARQGDAPSNWISALAINEEHSGELSGVSFKLSDAEINELVHFAYKITGQYSSQTRYFKPSCIYSQITTASGDCLISHQTLTWQGLQVGTGSSSFRGLADYSRNSKYLNFVTADTREHVWFVGNEAGYKDSKGQHWPVNGTFTANANFWLWVK